MDEKNNKNNKRELDEDILNESVLETLEKYETEPVKDTEADKPGFATKVKGLFVRVGKWAKDSKLNMSVLVTTCVMTILILIVIIIIAAKGGVDNKLQQTTVSDPTGDNNQEETTMPTPAEDELFTTDVNENENGNYVYEPEILSTKMTIKGSWISDGIYYTQYNVAITNVSNQKIDGWAVVVRADNSLEITDNWNAQFSVKGTGVTILPFPDNEVIDVDETINVGFVVSSYRYVYFNEATVFQNAKYETYKISVSQIQNVTRNTDYSTLDSETTSENEMTTREQDSTISETTSSYEKTTSEEQTTEEETTTTFTPEETTTTTTTEETTTGEIPEETTSQEVNNDN